MAILVSVLTAVILVSFGSQSLITASQLNAEAISLAQAELETTQALARQDFCGVVPVAEIVEATNQLLKKKIDVEKSADDLTRKVTATVSWTTDKGVPQHVQLTTLVTNFQNVTGTPCP